MRVSIPLVTIVCAALIVFAVQAEGAKKKSQSKSSSSSTTKKKASSSPTPKKKASASPSPKAKTKSSPSPTPRKKKTSSKATPAPKSGETSGTSDAEKPASEEKKSTSATPAPEEPTSTESSATPAVSTTEAATPRPATPVPSTPKPKLLPAAVISTDDLLGYGAQPPRVQDLIRAGLELAKQKLTYTYGSADPAKGGMDCSGAIYYLLRQQGYKDVPRDAAGQYVWARKHGQFFAVVSKKADSFELGDLQPGDLMFWSGTYEVDKDPPVTHTMIYLGVQRKRAQHVMWGASDGRLYDGKPRWGVGVFDFKMPKATRANGEPQRTDFLGYARIPGLREATSSEQ